MPPMPWSQRPRAGAAPLPDATLDPVALALHAVPALTLIIIPFQLHADFRARQPQLHRDLGSSYAVLVLIGARAAIRIARATQGDAVSAAGFTVQALLSLATLSGIDFDVANRAGAWLSWVINLGVAEYLLRRRGDPPWRKHRRPLVPGMDSNSVDNALKNSRFCWIAIA